MEKRLIALGDELTASTPDELERHLRDEIVKWGKVVKQSGARHD